MNPMTNLVCKAKDIESGNWVAGFYLAAESIITSSIHHYIVRDPMHWGFGEFSEVIEVAPETVCRCTGLNDKNGQMIFENDILQGTFYHAVPDNGIFEVVWNEQDAGFNANSFDPHKCEIIGNKIDDHVLPSQE